MDIRHILESLIDPANGERIMDSFDLYEEFMQVMGFEPPNWEAFNLSINGILPGGWCLRGAIGETVLLAQCKGLRDLGYVEAADRWYAARHNSIVFFIDNLQECVDEALQRSPDLNPAKIRNLLILNVAHERRHSYQDISLFSQGGMASTMEAYDALPHEADANNYAWACVNNNSLLAQADTYLVDTTCRWTH